MVAAVLVSVAIRSASGRRGAFAVMVEGSLYLTTNEAKTAIQKGEKIGPGDAIRSAGARDTALLLADGSWLEMRPDSELSLERARDGIRIRLGRGSVIVNAAKQRVGQHLYVETKDLALAVVGTVFLVIVEENGSHVAVLEGEVRVRQGATEKKLSPGEHMVTDPKFRPASATEEVAWARRAAANLSRLKQSALPLQIAGKKDAEPRLAFDEVSIRPRASSFGGRGGVLPNGFTPACYGNPQIDPARFSIANTTVFQLIALAYGRGCERWESQGSDSDALAGAPRWIREERFDVQAVMPEGIPPYTPAQLARGQAPEIQSMLQTMLADRFKLVLERRMKEMPVYVLTVAKGGPKLTPSQDGKGRGLIRTLRTGADGQPRPSGFSGGPGGSMEQLAPWLSNYLGRPVLDRTGIAYGFSYELDFALPGEDCTACPSAGDALQDKLGLKLDSARAPVEVLVLNRVEKPSEN
jgi:uncharacterized protein (TIGR03435 family)